MHLGSIPAIVTLGMVPLFSSLAGRRSGGHAIVVGCEEDEEKVASFLSFPLADITEM